MPVFAAVTIKTEITGHDNGWGSLSCTCTCDRSSRSIAIAACINSRNSCTYLIPVRSKIDCSPKYLQSFPTAPNQTNLAYIAAFWSRLSCKQMNWDMPQQGGFQMPVRILFFLAISSLCFFILGLYGTSDVEIEPTTVGPN